MIPAANAGLGKVLRAAGWRVDDVGPFGPAGMKLIVGHELARGSVIVSQFDRDGVEWLHASLAWADRMPTYEELRTLHRAVFGRCRWSYEVHAPAADHVDIHEFARHLWGRVDGIPGLPDFVHGLGTL